MKKILCLFTWMLVAAAALACEVTFDPTWDVGTYAGEAGPFSICKDGITVTFSNGVANGSHYRVYKNQTITICSEVGDLTRIEFTCVGSGDEQYGPGGFVVDTGTYSYEGRNAVWEGRARCVTFTAVNFQVRISLINVTYDCEGELFKPIITPPSGTYYEPIEVSISCPTEGATIHYTTNGSNPTVASTEYTAPFAFSSNGTVKAIAIKDGETSEVVAADYEFATSHDVGSITDAVTFPDDSVVRFLNPVTALAQHGNYLYVKDDTGYALIFGNCGQTYAQGDIIPGGFYATKTTYNGEPEFSRLQGMLPAIGNTSVVPEDITADQVGHDLFAHLVHLDNVTFSKDDGNYTLTDEQGNTCPVYFGSMGVAAPYDLTSPYEVCAIVGSYGKNNTVYQLLPVELISHGPELGLCSLFNMPDNTSVVFDHEAIAIYQNGYYLYLKDECGYGLVYGNVGQTYQLGDVIPPGWGGTKKTWAGEPEIGNPTGFQPATSRVQVEPEIIRLTDVGHRTWAHFVFIKDVYIDRGNKLLVDREGNTCPYYPEPPFDVVDGEYRDFYAIVTSYGNNPTIYQLCIINYGTIIPPPPGVCCMRELYNQPQNQPAPFDSECPLTVIYQKGLNLYVKDKCEDFGLIYGNVGGTFEPGDLILGSASWTTYSGCYQLTPYGDWEKVGKTDPVKPEEMPIEELSQDMAHWYFCFKNVKIIIEDGKAYIEDETGRIRIFDKFQCEVENDVHPVIDNPCDVNQDGEVTIADINVLINAILSHAKKSHSFTWQPEDIDPDATYDVWGFLTVYKNELELYPVRIVLHGMGPSDPWLRYDVNGDGEVTIADINCVIDFILSIY